ncbi:actin-associated protein FAM107A isoform X2 [Peromyscus californicus insignis]|uniref:actin-associated protein FAM107A isoform X2 n=1 Tax=Peromyscus californicus insignis TaxID=564181 RepID=UPI0022A6659E|nr:actin-associated protein FAM107A isoform X2 [Peromyscus californicus insignis]
MTFHASHIGPWVASLHQPDWEWVPGMALPNPIPAACSLHRSQRPRTAKGGQEAKLERGRLRSMPCCKVVQMPAVPIAPGTETVCAPSQPSYTTSVSEAYCNQIPRPAGGAARRVTITETLLRLSVQAQQWGHSAQGMAQKLDEWTKAPAEATGLYRAMLLRSGRQKARFRWSNSLPKLLRSQDPYKRTPTKLCPKEWVGLWTSLK